MSKTLLILPEARSLNYNYYQRGYEAVDKATLFSVLDTTPAKSTLKHTALFSELEQGRENIAVVVVLVLFGSKSAFVANTVLLLTPALSSPVPECIR